MEYRIAESASGSAVLHITEVHALSGFRLWAKFSTGETRVLDFTPLLDTEAFRPLCDPALFGQVGLVAAGVGEQDLAQVAHHQCQG